MFTRNSALKISGSALADTQYDRSMLLHSDFPKHLNQLRSCREAIHGSPLIEEAFTLPIECDDVIDYLESMGHSMTKIREVIKALHERRDNAFPSSYKLLMYLYAADDHLRSAMNSVEQYRPICINKTSKSRHGQTKVQGELRTVIQTCEKVEIEAGSILDELLLNS